MHDRSHTARGLIAPFALIALTQALLFSWLRLATDESAWPATAPGVFYALLLASVFTPAAAYLLVPAWAGRRALVVLAAILAFLLAAGAHYGLAVLPAVADFSGGGEARPALFCHVLVLLFIVLSWFAAAVETGHAWPDYPVLFRRGAEHLVLGALSVAVCGLVWMLLVVTASLFRMIGIDVLEVLLLRIERVTLMVVACSVAAAIYVVMTTPRLLPTILAYKLSLLQRVLPFATLLLYGFVLALAWRTPAILASHERVISAQWLLWMAVLVLLLLNARWRDGRDATPAPGLLARLVRFAPLPLALLTALAIYAIAVRIDAYGLTVQRVEALFVALVTFGAAAGYCIVPLSRRGTAAVGGVNSVLALVLVATLALMALPPLSPQRLAAWGMRQFILAQHANPTRESIASLWYDDGQYGREAVASLATLPVPAERAAVQALAAEVMKAFSRMEFTSAPRRVARWDAAVLRVYPGGTPVPPGLLRAMDRTHLKSTVLCSDSRPCALVFQSLSFDTTPEALLLSGEEGWVYREVGQVWTPVAALHVSACVGCTREGFLAALERGQLHVRPSEWQVLEAGGTTVRVDGTR